MWMLMSPWLHITTTTLTACFAAIQQICSVRCSLSRDALMMLVHALVVSKLDYCNSVLVGVSATLQWRLQSVLNAAARLVFSARRSAHIMSLLHAFHWLKVREWIQFPLCVLVHRCLHRSVLLNLEQMLHLFGWSPAHLRTIIIYMMRSANPLIIIIIICHMALTRNIVFVPALCPCFLFCQRVESHWAAGHFQWLQQQSGTH